MNHHRYHQAPFLLSLMMILALPACKEAVETISPSTETSMGYAIVGTNQRNFFDNQAITSTQGEGDGFYGQNANYPGNSPSYTDHGDGTLTDHVTGLMWQRSFDHNDDGVIDIHDKMTYSELLAYVDHGVSFAGYDDWRLPTIQEQYSLILFSGIDISGYEGSSTDGLTPFLDTDAFEFGYGDVSAGERLIDMQCATSTTYAANELAGDMVFGVNFADGRIKGYGTSLMGQEKDFNYLLVRGGDYGHNDFVNNEDGTISDQATGLMWMQADNGEGILWQEALNYAETMSYAGYSDWRLPDAKELQSLIDYTRAPDLSSSAAIDALFSCTDIVNEEGETDYPYYWSSTTHQTMMTGNEGRAAVYLSFGRALGYMNGQWVDVHGAGAQRSDPKTGNPDAYPEGHGPQGDAIRIYNYVRLVRSIN